MTRKPENRDGPVSREARLAEALRANLARRKAQLRARAQPHGPDADAGGRTAGENVSGTEPGES